MMSRILAVGLALLPNPISRAATPISIEVLRPNRTYRTRTSCDLKRVDFRNFTYFEGEWMGASEEKSPQDPKHLSNGKFSSREELGFEDISVESVAYPDLESAAVSLWHSYGGGSSNQELVVMVFRCVGGKLTNTQLIHGDGHGRRTGVIFSDGGRKMTMNSVYDYTNGHCCPRYLETAVFRFNRRGYVLVTTCDKEISMSTYQMKNRQPH